MKLYQGYARHEILLTIENDKVDNLGATEKPIQIYEGATIDDLQNYDNEFPVMLPLPSMLVSLERGSSDAERFKKLYLSGEKFSGSYMILSHRTKIFFNGIVLDKSDLGEKVSTSDEHYKCLIFYK